MNASDNFTKQTPKDTCSPRQKPDPSAAAIKARERYAAQRESVLARAKRRRQANRQNPEWMARQRETLRRWNEKHPGRMKALVQSWRESNYVYVRDAAAAKYREPAYCMKVRLHTRMKAALRRSGIAGTLRVEDEIGCDMAHFLKHIEAHFRDGMGWHDMSAFELDHIVPVSAFDLADPQQRAVAFNWQNVRPVWPKENWEKGAKVTEPQMPLPLLVPSEKICI
jgi:hypothetical protein